MDVCKAAPTATEIPLASLDHLLAEEEDQQSLLHRRSDETKLSPTRLDNDSPDKSESIVDKPVENDSKLVSHAEQQMTADVLVPTLAGLAAAIVGTQSSCSDGKPTSLGVVAQECILGSSTAGQSKSSQSHEQSTAPSLPTIPEKSDFPPVSTEASTTPLTPVTADDSMSSDDTTADTSQSSNAEWIKCQESTRRMSSASASSSTATISPSDTLAGASTTDESLSSDETALDLSQNSFESTKYQSDLESVSVSSIVRRAAPRSASEMVEDSSSRRVSFPMKDSDLVTGYMEPANPWESANSVTTANELIKLYKESCLKHNTTPIDSIIVQLNSLELDKPVRHNRLDLSDHRLTPEACEAMEEILKRVQYHTIDLTSCNLNDLAASAIFDMIEFYESAVEVDVSENPSISSAGLQSCISMIRKSADLRSIILRGNALSELHATNLGKAINYSNLSCLKLEHCGLTGRPLASLCNTLRNNKTLKELWLAHNDLYCRDADKIGDLLRANAHLQFLDVSNNNLKDDGIRRIAIALIEQATTVSFTTKRLQTQERLKASDFKNSFSDVAINMQSQTNSQERENSTNFVKSSTSGSRSMLDALLQMQPGECKEPVQIANLTSNNNLNKEKLLSDNGEVSEQSSSRNQNDEKPETIVEKLEPISEALSISKSDIEITVSCASSVQAEETQTEDQIVTNNNTLESSTNDIDLLGLTEDVPKIYDLNENKGNAGSEPLLIKILDDSISKETTPLGRSSNNSSPVIFDRPSSVDDNERHAKDDLAAYTTRSQSCDSLSSDNSLDAIETHLSAEIQEKITKNDTLGRQQKMNQNNENLVDSNLKPPRGLQALILWNNNLTRVSGECIADMIASTNSLEILNIGKNILSNDFINTISNSLKYNRTLTNLGLQSTHLNSVGIKKLADVLQFGGNSTLERIDIRDNNVQVDGLIALCDALKSNKKVTQIDIDDEPKRHQDDGDGQFHYSKYLQTVRGLIDKNQSTYEIPQIRNSRKISLTCQSIQTPPAISVTIRNDSLDVKKKSGARLRSPLPSPPTASPSSSPVPSPSRGSRFQVSRVSENIKSAPLSSSLPQLETVKTPEPIRSSPSPTSRFRVTMVKLDDTLIKKEKRSVLGLAPSLSTTNGTIVNDKPAPVKNETSDIRFVFPEVPKPNETIALKAIDASLDQPKVIAAETIIESIIEKSTFVNVETQTTVPIVKLTEDSSTDLAKESNHCIITTPFKHVIIEPVVEKKEEKDKVDNPSIEKAIDSVINSIPSVSKIEESFLPAPVIMASTPIETIEHIEAPPVDLSDIPIILGEVDSGIDSSSSEVQTTPAKTETRVRKTSWNSPANAVDKFSSFIQQISSNIFNRSSSSESDRKSSESCDSLSTFSDVLTKSITSSSGSERGQVSKNYQSSDLNVIPSKTHSLLEAASKQLKEIKDFGKQVLQLTPIPTTQQSLPAPLPLTIAQNPIAACEESPTLIFAVDDPASYFPQESGQVFSTQINLEIKETHDQLPQSQQQQQQSLISSSCVHNNDIPISDEIFELDTNNQVVDLDDKKKSSDPATAATQMQQLTTQGNDKHDM